MIYYALHRLTLVENCVECRLRELFPDVEFSSELICSFNVYCYQIKQQLLGQNSYLNITQLLQNVPTILTAEKLLHECETHFRLTYKMYQVYDLTSLFHSNSIPFQESISNIIIHEHETKEKLPICCHIPLNAEIKIRNFGLEIVLQMIDRDLTLKYNIDTQELVDSTGNKIAMYAIRTAQLDLIDYLINELNFELKIKFESPYSMTHDLPGCIPRQRIWSFAAFAARYNNESLIYLLNKDTTHIHEAMLMCLGKDDDEMFYTIIEKYDLSHISDSHRDLIVEVVIRQEKTAILDKLLSLGFKLYIDSNSTLEISSLKMIQHLIKLEVNIETLAKAASRPACRGDQELLKFVDETGYFTAQIAAELLPDAINGNPGIVDFLFSKGIDPEEYKKEIRHAISFIHNPQYIMIETLVKNGVDFSDEEIALNLWFKMKVLTCVRSAENSSEVHEYAKIICFLINCCRTLSEPKDFLPLAVCISPAVLEEILRLNPEIDVNQKMTFREFREREKYYPVRYDATGDVRDSFDVALIYIVLDQEQNRFSLLDLLFERGAVVSNVELESNLNHWITWISRESFQTFIEKLKYLNERGIEYKHTSLAKLIAHYGKD